MNLKYNLNRKHVQNFKILLPKFLYPLPFIVFPSSLYPNPFILLPSSPLTSLHTMVPPSLIPFVQFSAYM